MRFADPRWLLALVLIPLVWWIHRQGVGGVPVRQRRVALWVRSSILAFLVMALAGASLVLPERRLSTAFVVDVSDSAGPLAKDRSLAFIGGALDDKPPDALAGVVAFGRDARVESTMSDQANLVGIASHPDSTRTDLARALRLAAAMLPEGTRRRIVVLSDGRQNSGDAHAEAARLKELGIRLDAVTISSNPGPDAAVVRVKTPSRVRAGDEFDLEVVVAASGTGRARLVITRSDGVTDERNLDLNPGEQTIKLTQQAADPGALTYRVELRAEKDSVPQNDIGAAVVVVAGPPRVLVLEQSPDEGQAIAKALADRGFSVDRRSVSAFPASDELAATDAVVLVDAQASSLTGAQAAALGGFVRQLGRGLVAIGGENSWSLGGYRNTPLEDLLPLESDIKDPRRRPSIAQVLAIDTSGSMASCHCAGPNMRSDRLAQGPNKTDISRGAAAKAIESMSADDEVGVLAFNTGSKWVLPLQKLPSMKVVESGLASMTPTGGTSIPQALQVAVTQLKTSKTALKHIILFTDGWTQVQGLAEVAAWVKSQGITLSVVATGEGAGTELARMAEEGAGRFYEGTNLYQLPDIFMEEVMLASRRYVNEGQFYPKVTGASAAVSRLKTTPPLLGYVGTSAKPSASVLLAVGEFDDPLLATWRTGLGVATAWTSDAKARWSAQWISWDGFADFWSDVAKETLPGAPTPGFSTQATASGEGLDIVVESENALPEGVHGVARVVAPNGDVTNVDLGRAGVNRLAGTAAASSAGTYLVSVDLTATGSAVYRDTLGAVRSYSAEYMPGPPNETLLRELTKATGGRLGITPRQAFDSNLKGGLRRVEIWKWLALVAALLLPVDVALRRVILTREDVALARAWRPWWMRKAAARSTVMSRLLEAKYRLRQVEEQPEPRAPAPSRAGNDAGPRAPAPGHEAWPKAPAPGHDTEPKVLGTAEPRSPEQMEPSVPAPDSRAPAPPPAAPAATGASELLKRKRAAREKRERDQGPHEN
jgi:Mg-chelatase subunit ChlD